MLLLYTRMVRYFLTPLEWNFQPNPPNYNSSETEKERQGSNSISPIEMTDKIRHNQEVYYLERRFLL